jgi:predicted nucleic acid-binding protein
MVKESTDRPILLDNTVLSNFAAVGQVELIFRLWPDRAITTPETLSEYQFAVQIELLPAHAWANLPVADLSPEEIKVAEAFSSRLGLGERTCLAVAQIREGLFASDDADARAAAKRLGIPVTGTLGVLAVTVRCGLISLDKANSILDDMIAVGYRSPLERLDTLI